MSNLKSISRLKALQQSKIRKDKDVGEGFM